MKGKKIVSTLLVLLLLASLPVSAHAAVWDIGKGDITVNAGSGGQTVTQGSQVDIPDSAPVITGSSTENTVTINAEKDQTSSVTLSGANIDVSNEGKAAVSTNGEGNVSIELDSENMLKSGWEHAGLEKNNGGSLTIADEDKNGKLKAEGGKYGAGIGGGDQGHGSDITITGGEIKATGGERGAGIGGGNKGNGDNIAISGGEVEATGGVHGAGIGGGEWGKGKDITVSGDAKLKVQSGVEDGFDGAGAGIGDGGRNAYGSPIPGAEVEPDTSDLLTTGWIEYYAPGADMEKDKPTSTTVGTSSQPEKPIDPGADAPLYRVTDKDGKDIAYTAEQKGGVLTVTVDEDLAILTGRLSGIRTLKAQGVEKIVFVTKGAASAFLLSDLLGKGESGEAYRLTHDGKAVTFTLGEKMTDVSAILTKP